MAQDVRHSKTVSLVSKSISSPPPNLASLEIWLSLNQVPRFGFSTLMRFVKATGHPAEALLALSAKELALLGFDAKQITAITKPDQKLIASQIKWSESACDRFILYPSHPQFPALLGQISRPPLILFGNGNQALLDQHQIAIVGSRNPTHYGKQQAFELAQSLALHNICITSGMAMGIDACAHKGALAANGSTIAVLGSGLANLYPKRNAPLADKILNQQGLLLSEFSPETAPTAANFPRRNRIVSGLSLGVLVIEAAMRSGSLITSKYALEQNREVLAVPGNVLNPLSAGCHYLIKQGAKLVETVDDILDEFQNIRSSIDQSQAKKIEKSQTESLASGKLLDNVAYDVTALDVIIQRSKLPIEDVLAQLLEYELRGLVASVSGGYIKLRGK
ncbi:DNA-processing protein DprA [Aliiglaciecola litoralis]|uniref:DNA-processing protein DprA n=1 Tax=Aliiglaciecola litoralis TaxID=582857 RepID=A0ABN1LTD1_9ALTE